MNTRSLSKAFLLGGAAVVACSTQAKGASDTAKPAAEPLSVKTATVESKPLERFLRVTGSLVADEQAEVSAETAGRVVATPVERGTRVAAGTLLVRISATETTAQLQEAEANASQIEARLGLDQLIALSRSKVKIETDPARLRPSDVEVLLGDASKFRAETGWEPKIPLEKTLADSLDYWRGRFAARRSPVGA